MTAGPTRRRPSLLRSHSAAVSVAVLGLLAYVPALASSPGRMPADTKLYLYLDPGGLWSRAPSTLEPEQFAGWVPHQQITYLWPSGPWYWAFDTLAVPDWLAHRLWIGTLFLAAGAGVRWAARTLGLGPVAAITAAIVYQTSPYLLPYVSRTSLMLLPWAGLGWVVALTVRGCRRADDAAATGRRPVARRLARWRDPALIALVVATVGSVNAAALVLVAPAPALWLVHAGWSRAVPWRNVVGFAVRTVAACMAVSLWWVAMLVVQSRHGAPVLAYSESLVDVSRNSTGSEVLRALGYWLFYVRDPAGPATTASIDYLVRTGGILVSYAVVVVGLSGAALVAWPARRFVLLCVATGMVLAVGVHPIDDPAPLISLLLPDDQSGLALALRSSTRAVPVLVLGVALGAGALVSVLPAVVPGLRGRRRPSWRLAGAFAVAALAVLNLPALWTLSLVDPAIDRDQDPPPAWVAAAGELDGGADHRVLQLPGAEFGSFRWGHTVDQPVVGLTDRPLVTRDLLPLGSSAVMDLLFALDDRVQEGWFEVESLAPVARLLAADRVWLANDSAFDRFRTARPEPFADVVTRAAGSAGVGAVRSFGEPVPNVPDVAMLDAEALVDSRVGEPLPPVQLVEIERVPGVLRAKERSVVVSGSGDGIVDAAAAGLIDGTELIRYSAALPRDELAAALAEAELLVVTDSNRDRARHWRGSQDVHGHTEPGGPGDDVLVPATGDRRLDVFGVDDPDRQTVALQLGPVRATASAYGEPFAYRPEDRAVMAVDGDPDTAWTVGDHGDPIGERLRIEVRRPTTPRLVLRQVPPPPGGRVIRTVDVVVDDGDPRPVVLGPESWRGGQPVDLAVGATSSVEVVVTSVSDGDPAVAASRTGVGFTEVDVGLGPVTEVVRPPRDALREAAGVPLAIVMTRLRTEPTNGWRDDPERELVRSFELPDQRTLEAAITLRLDPDVTDATLDELVGRSSPAVASTRLVGSPGAGGRAAVDGDPGTAWITPFDGATGAQLLIDTDELGPELVVHQPAGPYSTVRGLRIAGPTHSVEVEVPPPDAEGTSTVALGGVLDGPATLTVTEVEHRDTIDRRYGDVITLPAAIGEIDGTGVDPLDDRATRIEVVCDESLLQLDGRPIGVSYSTTVGSLLAGEPVDATPCGGPYELGLGEHRLTTSARDHGLTVDRVVLGDAPSSAAASVRPVTVDVVEDGAHRRVATVGPCPAGCWMVLGEGINDAWTARLDGTALGAPEPVDGGSNGWWLPPSSTARTVEITWTVQWPVTVGLASSIAAVLACVTVAVLGRPPPGEPRPAPRVARARRSGTSTARTLRAGLVLAALGLLFIDAAWVLVAGALTGVVLVVRRRRPHGRLARRPFEWLAVAGAIAVAIAVAVIERRSAPLPNAGWTLAVDHLHGLAVFVALLLAAGATDATDATDTVDVGAAGGIGGVNAVDHVTGVDSAPASRGSA